MLLFQNQEIILAKQSFKLDLMVADEYHSPELSNGIIYFVCLLTGFFVAFFAGLADRFKFKKNIKTLKTANDSLLEEISAMKSKVQLMQSVSARPAETVVENAED